MTALYISRARQLWRAPSYRCIMPASSEFRPTDLRLFTSRASDGRKSGRQHE